MNEPKNRIHTEAEQVNVIKLKKQVEVSLKKCKQRTNKELFLNFFNHIHHIQYLAIKYTRPHFEIHKL